MLCPKCDAKSIVYNSRRTDDGSVRRNRECYKCFHRYATLEVLAPVQAYKRGPKRKLRNGWVNPDDVVRDALEKGWVRPEELD